MSVVPIQAAPVKVDFYEDLLKALLPLFTLLMYIPILYRTVYRLVSEKATRVRETMRMMGMTETPYWSSWLAYYTFLNILLGTLAWAVLMINSFPSSSSGYLWLFIVMYG